jgi:hypothetical protein
VTEEIKTVLTEPDINATPTRTPAGRWLYLLARD